MQVQFLYGKQITSKEQLHQYLAERLAFPAHYGGNLDALYDCLCERSEALELTIKDSAALQKQLSNYGDSFLRVLKDAAMENRSFRLKIQ